MLKVKLNATQYEELPSDELREHYREDGKGGYILVTDESTGAQRALAAERSQKSAAEEMLIKLVPELANLDDREKWRDAVDARVQVLAELDDINPDDVRRFRDREEEEEAGERVDESETQQKLREAQVTQRKLEREISQKARDVERLTAELDTARSDKEKLIRARDINGALDAANITSPYHRKIAKALWTSEEAGYGLKVVDGETMIVVDDVPVPLSEWSPDWANTDEGREFATAPDNSGGGDGGEVSRDTGNRDSYKKRDGRDLTPAEMIAESYKRTGARG